MKRPYNKPQLQPLSSGDRRLHMKYRKKPVVIEAFRFGFDVVPEWFLSKLTADQLSTYRDLQSCEIGTLEGTMRADRGDFIIQGVKGEMYPCKPDIFEATYEPAE